MPSNIVAIIQARMSSTRLPGKVLMEIDGRPMLSHIIRRTQQAKSLNQVVVATSTDPSDDAIVAFCKEDAVACFRGSLQDVLDRYYQAAKACSASAIVRITADCPLIDPDVIDRVIETFLTGRYDYVSNTLRYTYPEGLDTEVFSFEALERAWRVATRASDREHVTPFMRVSDEFRLCNVENDVDLSSKGYHWSVDAPTDLEFVREVYKSFQNGRSPATQEVINLVEQRSDLKSIQQEVVMNDGYYKNLYIQAVAGAATKRSVEKSQAWFTRAQKVIPGCAQTFSKGYTQYVQGVSPIFLQQGRGCRVWDVDGNEYIDYVQGLLPNILGYAHAEVNQAAAEQLAKGHSFSLPTPLEVLLAERLTKMIPCAEMVRFGKNGSDATSGAVRAARAWTGRERIACCGYHGWQDWYIGSTARYKGVPGAVRALTHTFPYNDLTALENLFAEHPGEFAAVIMEPVNFAEPTPGYLAGVLNLAHRHGALLIFDEICTGFRFGLGGAQKLYGVTPDLACFGKALGNGFPIACVVGRSDVMKIFEEVFFSFTLGGESASIAAAMKVLDILEQTDALLRMEALGSRLRDGFNAMARQAKLADRFQCVGRPIWSALKFRDPMGNDSLLERSLFQQEIVKRGLLLLTTHNMSAAHDELSTERTLEVYATTLKTLADWLSDRQPSRFLEGSMIQPVFQIR